MRDRETRQSELLPRVVVRQGNSAIGGGCLESVVRQGNSAIGGGCLESVARQGNSTIGDGCLKSVARQRKPAIVHLFQPRIPLIRYMPAKVQAFWQQIGFYEGKAEKACINAGISYFQVILRKKPAQSQAFPIFK
ncbi:hypothetical protein BC351_33355 [Paenibacillus ferrarius]|uniref:Uncharacterized protein n=1 Tax=Paenibacillus ferrarius TaxID=1469647 RepID=A0A1V4HEE6_9BACL|nr:hypothetical protein BC351_33355 [Paenibacillus ferrarius]